MNSFLCVFFFLYVHQRNIIYNPTLPLPTLSTPPHTVLLPYLSATAFVSALVGQFTVLPAITLATRCSCDDDDDEKTKLKIEEDKVTSSPLIPLPLEGGGGGVVGVGDSGVAEAEAAVTSPSAPPRAGHAVRYGFYLALMDLGESVSGWVTAPIVAALGIS